MLNDLGFGGGLGKGEVEDLEEARTLERVLELQTDHGYHGYRVSYPEGGFSSFAS